MGSDPVEVRMLGEFSLRSGATMIRDNSSRAKKVWLFLAYMICNRTRSVSSEEMARLLWGDDDDSTSNPRNALKTMLHRVRAVLEPLEDAVGQPLILRKGSAYTWNTDLPVTHDIDDFERLCQGGAQAEAPEEKIRLWLEASSLYRGGFLSKLSSEPWVVPLAAHYHGLYVDTILTLLPLLEERDRWTECEALCQIAAERDPYIEGFYFHWMRALLHLEKQREAVAVYEGMSELFLAEFGVMPSDELRSLYRDALRDVNDHTLPSGMILEQLREPPDEGGALLCEYDMFKCIYHSLARSILRSGDVVHLGLISVLSQNGAELPRRSLDRVMLNLRDLIRTTLRRGDIAARCSVSQYIIMLPQANFENSCMVCDRLIRAFNRQYPHSPARLHASVHPIQPN